MKQQSLSLNRSTKKCSFREDHEVSSSQIVVSDHHENHNHHGTTHSSTQLVTMMSSSSSISKDKLNSKSLDKTTMYISPQKKVETNYWKSRDNWPTYQPPQFDSSLTLTAESVERTGSILAHFDPNSKLKIKPVTEGSIYPTKCRQVSEEHSKRSQESFTLTRGLEPVEMALLAESSETGRQFEATTPLPLDAKGVSSANSKKTGLMSTQYKQGDRTIPEEKSLIIPVSALGRRQQPAIPDPFYRTASSAIVPGFPNKPYTLGKGLSNVSHKSI